MWHKKLCCNRVQSFAFLLLFHFVLQAREIGFVQIFFSPNISHHPALCQHHLFLFFLLFISPNVSIPLLQALRHKHPDWMESYEVVRATERKKFFIFFLLPRSMETNNAEQIAQQYPHPQSLLIIERLWRGFFCLVTNEREQREAEATIVFHTNRQSERKISLRIHDAENGSKVEWGEDGGKQNRTKLNRLLGDGVEEKLNNASSRYFIVRIFSVAFIIISWTPSPPMII